MILTWGGREIQFKLVRSQHWVTYGASSGDLALCVAKDDNTGQYHADGAFDTMIFSAGPELTAQKVLDALHNEVRRLHAELGQSLAPSEVG